MTKELPGSVYLEGSDCAGKSRVGREVAERLGIEKVVNLYLYPEANPWNADRTKAISSDHPLFPAFLVQATIWDIIHYRSEPRLQTSFVACRSAAWQKASGEPLAHVFYELLDYCPLFAYPFLLHASIECKKKRLDARWRHEPESVSPIDLLIVKEPDFIARMDEALVSLARVKMAAQVIDTTGRTVEETTGMVLGMINGDIPCVPCSGSRKEQKDLQLEMGRFQKEIADYVVKTGRQHQLEEQEVAGMLQMVRWQG